MSVNIYGMPTGVQIPMATDFRQNQTASSRYRFRRTLGEGSQAQAPFAVQTTSTTDINFRFGAGYVINLAKTRLRICESIINTAVGTATAVRAIPPIAAIRLQTSSGVVLFDIQNCDAYMSAVYPFTNKFADRDKLPVGVNFVPKPGYTIAASPVDYDGVCIGNLDFTTYPGGGNSNMTIVQPIIGTGTAGAATPTFNGVAASVDGMVPGGPIIVPGRQIYHAYADGSATGYTQSFNGNAYIAPDWGNVPCSSSAALPENQMPRQYIVANQQVAITSRTGQAAGKLFLQWDVPLASLLPHTVCAALQDLYFGTDLLLTVSFQAMQRRAYQATHGINAQADYNPPVTAFSNAGTAVPATNCYYATDLLLATQDNQDLVNSVKQEIAGKGIRIPIQQPFISIEAPTASATADVVYSRTLRLNIARGAALLRSYMCIMNNLTAASGVPAIYRCMNNQVIALSATTQRYAQWNRYRVYLNAVPMSDSSLDPRDQFKRSQDWMSDGFCRSFEAWLQLGGVCVEDFTSGFDLTKTTPEGGLPLANPIDVQVDTTISQYTAAPAATEHLFVGVMLKYLSISPSGVTCESA